MKILFLKYNFKFTQKQKKREKGTRKMVIRKNVQL